MDGAAIENVTNVLRNNKVKFCLSQHHVFIVNYDLDTDPGGAAYI